MFRFADKQHTNNLRGLPEHSFCGLRSAFVSTAVYNNLSLMKSGSGHYATQDDTFVRSTID
jgi:hypothetical protein